MSERVRVSEEDARRSHHAPAPNNPYYFPPASYSGGRDAYPAQPQGQAHPGQGYPGQGYPGQPYPGQGFQGQAYPGQGFPGQGYQGHGYPSQGFPEQGYPQNYQPGYPQPASYPYPQGPVMPPYAGAPHYPAPAYHQAPPLAGYGHAPSPYAPQAESQGPAGNVDDAFAQIAARIRALDTDPADGEAIAPVAPQLAPSYPAAGQSFAALHRAAPSVDLSGLEGQLRNLTAQIETLRQPVPDFSGILRELRQDLGEISNRLLEAMPRRAIDALEEEVRRLADRIEMSRSAGVDPDAIAGMERSLAEVRDAIRSLKPAESLAGFEQAVRNLTARLDQSAGAYTDAASLQQLESAIAALRGIVTNVASNDTLAGLSEEIRGLSARVDRVASSPRGFDSEMLQTIEQRIAKLPVLGAIERGFAELMAKFDQFQVPAQPALDPTPAVDHLKRDLVRTQDSLEAVHSTLGHLVDRLAMIEDGIREARFAAEAPVPVPGSMLRSGPVPPYDPMLKMDRGAPAVELPLQPAEAPHIAPMMPESIVRQPAMPHAGSHPASSPQSVAAPHLATPAKPNTTEVPKSAIRSAMLDALKKAESAAASAPEPAQPAPAMRERNPIDPSLPPDFPLEPGFGTARPHSSGSAAERIAASEAALAGAKPGEAGQAGQTNFIAAARRAAQAAATAAPDISASKPEEGSGTQSASISRKVRSLFVGATAIVLAVVGARFAIDMFDHDGQSVAEISAPAISDMDEEPESQKPSAATAPAIMPVKPDAFAVPPSGVIERPRTATSPAVAPTDGVATGSVAPASRPANPTVEQPAALSRGPLAFLPEKLPAGLRNAAAKGQPAAEFEVGIRQIEGRGVPQNTEAGLRWLERAAESGLAPAHFRIAGLYEKGIGVKKSLATARLHYIAAADKGNAKAMHNLAVLYAEGIDGKPDYKTAAEWFRRAAEFGVADSQYNLAILHARGIGVEQNITESYKWLALAAMQGDNDAAKKRDEIASKIDAGSLASARAAVQSFTPQQQPDDAVTVAAPPGGWDRPAAEQAPGRKPRAGSVARVTAS